MKKLSNREKILIEGTRLVLERGFFNASVRDIIEAAGVPQGSFTNHFTSKEMFGLEILCIYQKEIRAVLDATLRNHAFNPMDALRAFIEANKTGICNEGLQYGCLSVNFSAEASMHSERLRRQLLDIFDEVTAALSDCLQRAVAGDLLPCDIECDALAAFILQSLHGAILLAKVRRSVQPIEQLKYGLFDMALAVHVKPKAARVEFSTPPAGPTG